MTAIQLALLPEVFHGVDAEARLVSRLSVARKMGAEVVVLPELPLDPWVPVRRAPDPSDAEEPGGPRQSAALRAAAEAQVWLVAGAIVRDAQGRRHNTAIVIDPAGGEVARYRKVHLPREPGFWETSHYEPGTTPPRAFQLAGFAAGLQICSDVNRPQGSLLLGAQGVELIVAPRATEPAFYPRWKMVLRANALTCASYVVCVNRPREDGTPLGGPSVAIDPEGEVLCETEELALVTLFRDRVAKARKAYPGYLKVDADLYARGWLDIGERDTP